MPGPSWAPGQSDHYYSILPHCYLIVTSLLCIITSVITSLLPVITVIMHISILLYLFLCDSYMANNGLLLHVITVRMDHYYSDN